MSEFLVEVTDFQSIKHAKLELVDGINIITGKTNAGKSALFRAIDSALFNKGDDSLVRSGKRYSVVTLSNGVHSITFKRDSKTKNEKTSYSLDGGEEIKKVGRVQLPEVAKMFNIRDIRMANNVTVRINFWYQNDKPFLMDRTAGQLYEFLSLSSCDRHSRTLKKMGMDLRVQNAEIDSMNVRIDTVKTMTNKKQEFLDANEGFDYIYESAVRYEREDRALQNIHALIGGTQRAENQIADVQSKEALVLDQLQRYPQDIDSEVQAAKEESTFLSGLLNAITEGQKTEKQYKSTQARVSETQGALDTYKKWNGVDISALADENGKIQSMAAHIASYQTAKDRERAISNALVGINRSMEGLVLQTVSDRVSGLVQEEKALSEIEALFAEIKILDDRIGEYESNIARCTASVESAVLDIKKYKKEIHVCPLCGTVFE